MNDPHLDMPGLSTWIRKIPARIKTLEDYKLDELLAYAAQLKSIVSRQCNDLWRIPENEDIRPGNFDFWKEAEALEGIVGAEKERRATVLPPAQVAPETAPEPLTFERLFDGPEAVNIAVRAVVGTAFNVSKLSHLNAFFTAAHSVGLIKKKQKAYTALPLIAEYFGGHCNSSAAYNSEPDPKLESTLSGKMNDAKK